MPRARGLSGLTTLEIVLSTLVVVAFLVFVAPILIRRSSPDTDPDDGALALAAEAAAESALARAPVETHPPSLDGSMAVVLDVVPEPGPREGLERVRVAAVAETRETTLERGTGRFRLTVLRFFP